MFAFGAYVPVVHMGVAAQADEVIDTQEKAISSVPTRDKMVRSTGKARNKGRKGKA